MKESIWYSSCWGENRVKKEFSFFSMSKILEHINSDEINTFIKKGLLIEGEKKMKKELKSLTRQQGIRAPVEGSAFSKRKDVSIIVTGEKEKMDCRAREVYRFGGKKGSEFLTDQELLYSKLVSPGHQLRAKRKREEVGVWKKSIKHVNLY